MVGLKTFSLPLLVVLVALACISPAFAYDGLIFTPGAGVCGTQVSFYAPYAGASSNPPGLMEGLSCWGGDERYLCTFTVSYGASPGDYTVTSDEETGTFTVEPCPAVGGVVMRVDTFAVFGPWLAVIAIVGCIGTVVLVAKKHDH